MFWKHDVTWYVAHFWSSKKLPLNWMMSQNKMIWSFLVSMISINWTYNDLIMDKFSLPFINFGLFKKNSGFYLLTLQIPNWTINLVLHRLKSNVSEHFFWPVSRSTSQPLQSIWGLDIRNRIVPSPSIYPSIKTPLFDCFFPLKIHDTLSCSSVRKKEPFSPHLLRALCCVSKWIEVGGRTASWLVPATIKVYPSKSQIQS